MITPSEIKIKADKSFFKVLSAELNESSLFPIFIRGDKQLSGSNYSDWKQDIVPLHQESKSFKGKGYSVEWKEKIINGSRQQVPHKIYIESLEDLIYLTHRANDYSEIKQAYFKIIDIFPELKPWAIAYPAELLKYVGEWQNILSVCSFFRSSDNLIQYYIRELPIDVHTKFIEEHTGILRKLLDQLLPESKINKNAFNFTDRYKLKKPQIFTQIRVLDDDLKPYLGYEECGLSLEDTTWLKWTPAKVFIIENKTCFLTFPKTKGAVAIFGEGFKSSITKQISWLGKTQLYCWFDLDGAGFEMLNMIRQHYPNAISFLMNEIVFRSFEKFIVTDNPKLKMLTHLDANELELYHYLVKGKKRLEQERVSQQFILKFLEI